MIGSYKKYNISVLSEKLELWWWSEKVSDAKGFFLIIPKVYVL